MYFGLLIKGILTGIVVSLPLGPMSILVIQRTANKDFKSGIYSGLGIALTDSFWALIAGFSVSYIISFLRQYQSIIQIIGGIALLYLGIYIFRSQPIASIRKNRRKGTSPIQCFITAMLFALSNPAVVLAYIAVFASTSTMFDVHQPSSALAFIFGFFMGASGWWLIISSTINYFRHHFNLRILWWFNKISGSAIVLFVLVSTLFVLIKGNPNF